MTTRETGINGEQKASDYLISQGFSILERNWRTRTGEIDIIALKDEVIVFVEVKTLPNATIDMLKSVLSYRKQQRILKTSKCFLLNHRQYSNSLVRYDVIVMDMPGFPKVYHIQNAFSELV